MGALLDGQASGNGMAASWSQVTPNNPQKIGDLRFRSCMVTFAGAGGIWKWDGASTWRQVTPNYSGAMMATTPVRPCMVPLRDARHLEMGWSHLEPRRHRIILRLLVASGENLYGSFAGRTAFGNGMEVPGHRRRRIMPQEMVASDSDLYGSFTGRRHLEIGWQQPGLR